MILQIRSFRFRQMARVAIALSAIALLPSARAESQAQPPIVQPGAPGEPSRTITAEDASNLAGLKFTEADVQFMQGMISHHAQAIEMTDLLATRTERDLMRRLAQRIELSQEDEIRMMQEWLRERGQNVPSVETHHAHSAELMPGMLNEAEMKRLEESQGIEFDRHFLELMIKHHQGALTMVENLLAERGAAQDSQLYAFTSDITADQSMEIKRMNSMLAELSPDPRVHLKAGFRDAGEAVLNMERIATLAKPKGFYDPHAPAGFPMPPEPEEGEEQEQEQAEEEAEGKADEEAAETKESGEEAAEEEQEEEETAQADEPRPGILNFANTDLAFAGDVLFEGNYHGFNTYNVEDPLSPQLLSSIVCPGGQGDVSVFGNLLIMSVEQTRGRLDCGLQGVAEPASEARFRGIRIFDISDMRMPKQVAAVQTCRGSHTHTLVTDPDDEGNIYVFGSGTSSVRPGEELEGCSDESPGDDPNTALFSIDVIRIPVERPEEARIVNRPRIFADSESGNIAGLWGGGDHGPGTQRTSETNQCHDITVYPEIGLAAGACSGNGILLDVSDPVNPVRLDQVVDPGFAYWHSATFNNDGTKVIFTDEWGGGGRPRCRAFDPPEWGANAIFDIVDRKLKFRSYYKMPAPQTEEENCVAHNGSLVPVPGRDIMVQAWYQGGVSVFDFTDTENPVEIAYFDRGPIHEDQLVLAGYWSAYWYRGFIYGTEIARGLDVFKLLPSEHLTANEIEAASLVAPDIVNVQQQRRIEWPVKPAVARAYVDQLQRNDAIDSERVAALSAALSRADELVARESTDAETASELASLAERLESDGRGASGRDQVRFASLASTVRGIADSLR
jgi:uncharacterized protein (DUF305 family)